MSRFASSFCLSLRVKLRFPVECDGCIVLSPGVVGKVEWDDVVAEARDLCFASTTRRDRAGRWNNFFPNVENFTNGFRYPNS